MVKVLCVLGMLCCSVSLQAKEWLAVQEVDLKVQHQSALDFSSIFPMQAEPLIIQDGHFFTAKSNQKQRMHCAVMAFTRLKGGFPDKSHAEALANELQRRGYNLLRLHMLDMALMVGAKKNFGFNLKEMDKLFYLVYVLQKRGIYIELDAETSWNGGFADVAYPFEKNKHAMQLEIYLSQNARAHWKQLVQALLLKENPYTKRALLHEPSVVLVTLMNEMGMYKQLSKLYQKKKYPETLRLRLQQEVDASFQQWLKNKYHDVKRLNESWLMGANNFTDVKFRFKGGGKLEKRDAFAFIYDTEARVHAEMINYLRDEGYQGFITNLNASREILAGSVRNVLDVVTLHSYHDHPKKIGRLGKAAAPMRTQQNSSSLSNNLYYIRTIAPSRLTGKPFVVDEYNHPFPNPWRREAGIVFPAYASFQDWDGICRFAEPVQLSYVEKGQANTAISAFNVGMDPIARAGEVLSALLFRRGDVKVAHWQADIHLNQQVLIQRGATKAWPAALMDLSLGMQLGSDWGESQSMQVVFSNHQGVNIREPLAKVLRQPRAVVERVILGAKKSRLVPKEDIQLWVDKKQFVVTSRQTLAATFSGEDKQVTLDGLKLSNIQDAALVSVSALDTLPVAQSKRLLLTFQTDARNTGMVFADGGKTVKAYGGFPVRILRSKLSVSLKHGKPMKLYALNLRGERIKELPIQYQDKALSFDLDNKIQGWGPVVFYELVEQVKG